MMARFGDVSWNYFVESVITGYFREVAMAQQKRHRAGGRVFDHTCFSV